MRKRVAVLVSGGLDSCVLMMELTRRFREVFPLYVRCGLIWEEAEQRFLDRFLREVAHPNIRARANLDFPMGDLYQEAWYSSGQGIPGYHDPDEDWEIPGRNLILIAKSGVWCRLHGVECLALGSLTSNPFPDATPEFFHALQRSLQLALEFPLRILLPFRELHKWEVVRLGRKWPLQHTLSCASPLDDRHCGRCGKCRERRVAFQRAGVPDPTPYAEELE